MASASSEQKPRHVLVGVEDPETDDWVTLGKQLRKAEKRHARFVQQHQEAQR